MAFPAAAAALVQGGASIGSSFIAANAADQANHDARNFALMQGDIDWQHQQDAFNMQNTRDDEVWNRQNDYNLKLWQMQNQYNSPAAQMQRYKEAGLNPNLIYGQSNMGGSIATANLESGSVHSAKPGDYNPRVVDYSGIPGAIGNSLMNYLAFREKAAQIDNLKSANDVMKSDAMLKDAQAAGTLLTNTGTGFENIRKQAESNVAPQLSQISVDAAKALLRKTTVESDLALQKNERDAAMNSVNLREGAEKILNLRGMRMNMELDNLLKSLDYKYKSNGPIGTELMNRWLGRFMLGTKNILQNPPE